MRYTLENIYSVTGVKRRREGGKVDVTSVMEQMICVEVWMRPPGSR